MTPEARAEAITRICREAGAPHAARGLIEASDVTPDELRRIAGLPVSNGHDDDAAFFRSQR
jgi:hypothetical protein